jgi:enamine deaminase RidA (YjgF/YER057c/UK114 family)
METHVTITRIKPGKRMSEAVRHGNTVYLAGQVADDANGTIEVQARQALAAVEAALAEAGSNKSKLLTVQVILASMGDFAAMNAVYDAWIDPANPPTRATIEARLANPGYKIEVIAVAAID